MGLTNIVQLTQFTLNTLESVKNELPYFILDHLMEMTYLLKQYQELTAQQWDHDETLFQYNQNEIQIIKTHYHLIRACFETTSGMGPNICNHYFKQESPSHLIRDLQTLKEWVNHVFSLIKQPENNHLDLFKEQLVQLKEVLNQVDEIQEHTRKNQKDLAGLKREMNNRLRDRYQTLKLYLNGWYREKRIDYQSFFNDLKESVVHTDTTNQFERCYSPKANETLKKNYLHFLR